LFLELEPDEYAEVEAEVDVVVLLREEVLDDDDDVAESETVSWAGVRIGVCAGVKLAADTARRGGKAGAAWRAEWEREPRGARPGHCESSKSGSRACAFGTRWSGNVGEENWGRMQSEGDDGDDGDARMEMW
jgi:hypothetical protein